MGEVRHAHSKLLLRALNLEQVYQLFIIPALTQKCFSRLRQLSIDYPAINRVLRNTTKQRANLVLVDKYSRIRPPRSALHSAPISLRTLRSQAALQTVSINRTDRFQRTVDKTSPEWPLAKA